MPTSHSALRCSPVGIAEHAHQWWYAYDPLDAWYFWARQARAILSIAAALQVEEHGKAGDWQVIFGRRPWWKHRVDVERRVLALLLQEWLLLGDVRLRAVEGRVEAGDLSERRLSFGENPYRREVMRLVQRGERNKPTERCQHTRVDSYRRREIHAAVNDAMSDRGKLTRSGLVPQEVQQVRDGAVVAQGDAIFPRALIGDGTACAVGCKLGRRVEALEFAAKRPMQPAAILAVDRKFQA